MSFDHNLFQTELIQHYQNRLGWNIEIATSAAVMASDVLRCTHGGKSHYIPSRNIDRDAIKADYKSGKQVSTLARNYGVSAQTVRNIIR